MTSALYYIQLPAWINVATFGISGGGWSWLHHYGFDRKQNTLNKQRRIKAPNFTRGFNSHDKQYHVEVQLCSFSICFKNHQRMFAAAIFSLWHINK